MNKKKKKKKKKNSLFLDFVSLYNLLSNDFEL